VTSDLQDSCGTVTCKLSASTTLTRRTEESSHVTSTLASSTWLSAVMGELYCVKVSCMCTNRKTFTCGADEREWREAEKKVWEK
jgi:hypothetical protein